jgi:hypothetical protein
MTPNKQTKAIFGLLDLSPSFLVGSDMPVSWEDVCNGVLRSNISDTSEGRVPASLPFQDSANQS